MNLLTELASSSTALLFGPPAPVPKDPPSQRKPVATPASPPATPASRKAVLFKPNLGLADTPPKMSTKEHEVVAVDAPLPTVPEEATAMSASSLLMSSGASALSFLGSTVVSLTSAAASALAPAPPASTPQDDVHAKSTDAEGTMMDAFSNAVFSSAASVRDAVMGTVDTRSDSGAARPKPRAIKRASTLPVQLTASGEPFSDDPSISAMQRIPDHTCGDPSHKLMHCCSAPTIPTSDCTCDCAPAATSVSCECLCHLKPNRRESGHFHRVEQLVKGTKRVVRDIKNVL